MLRSDRAILLNRVRPRAVAGQFARGSVRGDLQLDRGQQPGDAPGRPLRRGALKKRCGTALWAPPDAGVLRREHAGARDSPAWARSARCSTSHPSVKWGMDSSRRRVVN
jgi:hypothetical protein